MLSILCKKWAVLHCTVGQGEEDTLPEYLVNLFHLSRAVINAYLFPQVLQSHPFSPVLQYNSKILSFHMLTAFDAGFVHVSFEIRFVFSCL